MKNQYFGDYRDLFKYDLIQQIMQQCPSLKQFSFIPMLTANDNRTDGNKRGFDERMKGRPGSENDELVEYLQYLHKYHRIAPEDRDFTEIRYFFEKKGVQTEIYNPPDHSLEEYFTHRKRYEYFSNVPNSLLKSALVFVDPDNGLEVKKSSHKHTLYSEVRSLLERMSDDSLLMIYQHFPRKEHNDYIDWRVQQFRNETNSDPLWISDNEIVFFFVVKSGGDHAKLKTLLSEYSKPYKKCWVTGDRLPSNLENPKG
ncbi:hypothetical protein [Methanoculleus oceani]|uniref:Uncharacterized protein n=1 Tax=Methanoculleus oceani TaxID=2184756 RepID=A0ABD4TGS6_9EURY|nr:hypothetical protein [Methanoculleus sp. CWC-02]MCM2466678.1 hypothetical protein [Methanoculleus sp. CWC-02]